MSVFSAIGQRSDQTEPHSLSRETYGINSHDSDNDDVKQLVQGLACLQVSFDISYHYFINSVNTHNYCNYEARANAVVNNNNNLHSASQKASGVGECSSGGYNCIVIGSATVHGYSCSVIGGAKSRWIWLQSWTYIPI